MLTVLVFWSWVLLLPRLPPWSRNLRLFPWASILIYEPLDIAWICCPLLPLPPVHKRDAQHMFLQHRGAHAEILPVFGKSLPLAPSSEGVSSFSETGADLWGGPGNFWESPGIFQGSPKNPKASNSPIFWRSLILS